MANIVEPQLLNLERAARYCGLSPGSFRTEVLQRGGVRVLRLGVGGAIKRVRVADLAAWIAAQAETPPVQVAEPPAPEPLDLETEDYP